MVGFGGKRMVLRRLSEVVASIVLVGWKGLVLLFVEGGGERFILCGVLIFLRVGEGEVGMMQIIEDTSVFPNYCEDMFERSGSTNEVLICAFLCESSYVLGK